MKRMEEHEKRIEILEEEIRNLKEFIFGKPRGPITMREARLANERGDKALLRQYYKQFSKRNPEAAGTVNSSGLTGNDDGRRSA